MLIYKLCLFVLYVLTNRFIICYNDSVVGDPTEQYRRTFLCKRYLNLFTGFGTFESRKRPARTGHNPATGATIGTPASAVPAFKVGKAFKDALKKQPENRTCSTVAL